LAVLRRFASAASDKEKSGVIRFSFVAPRRASGISDAYKGMRMVRGQKKQ